MRSSSFLTLLVLLALSLLATALPRSHGLPSNLRTSLSASGADLRRHKTTEAGTALTSQSPWMLRRLGKARGSRKSAHAAGKWEEVEVEVKVKRWVDVSGQKIAACKGWKEDGLAFWWTMWWDLRRLWRELRGKPVCDEEVQGEGSGKAEDGSGKPGEGAEKPVSVGGA
ncbi:hypothetical protein MMC17_006778 [Xylographa soralifera]|nr:hypothetical protein [Xylographa soralifera]